MTRSDAAAGLVTVFRPWRIAAKLHLVRHRSLPDYLASATMLEVLIAAEGNPASVLAGEVDGAGEGQEQIAGAEYSALAGERVLAV